MVFSKNEIDYEKIYKTFKDTQINTCTVLNFFDKNWHVIRTEWVVYFQSKYITLGKLFIFNIL